MARRCGLAFREREDAFYELPLLFAIFGFLGADCSKRLPLQGFRCSVRGWSSTEGSLLTSCAGVALKGHPHGHEALDDLRCGGAGHEADRQAAASRHGAELDGQGRAAPHQAGPQDLPGQHPPGWAEAHHEGGRQGVPSGDAGSARAQERTTAAVILGEGEVTTVRLRLLTARSLARMASRLINRRISEHVVLRWMLNGKGVPRRKLPSLKRGGRRYSTEYELGRFLRKEAVAARLQDTGLDKAGRDGRYSAAAELVHRRWQRTAWRNSVHVGRAAERGAREPPARNEGANQRLARSLPGRSARLYRTLSRRASDRCGVDRARASTALDDLGG